MPTFGGKTVVCNDCCFNSVDAFYFDWELPPIGRHWPIHVQLFLSCAFRFDSVELRSVRTDGILLRSPPEGTDPWKEP